MLVRGGGALSVLKPDAAYPGNLADDSQWIAAERIVDGQVSADEVDREGLVLWTLPAGTQNPGPPVQSFADAQRPRAGGLARRRVDQLASGWPT